jgi:hypothetical protein
MSYTEKHRKNFKSFGKGKPRNEDNTSFENQPKEPESQDTENQSEEDT